MSMDYGHLCSVIIKQIFGESVQLVTDCLFAANARTLANIVKATKLPKSEVQTALAILIRFELVSFSPSTANEYLAEYSLKRDEILYILRYPRYMQLIQTNYGQVGVDIIEHILYAGAQTATEIVLKCLLVGDNKTRGETYRETFLKMVRDNYLIRLPVPHRTAAKDDDNNTDAEAEAVPKLEIDTLQLFNPPEINLRFIVQVIEGTAELTDDTNNDVIWMLNFKRFHKDFRDALMIDVIERKLGANAGECFKYILQTMYERTDPWAKEHSNPFSYVEVRQVIEKNSNNLDLMKYLDQYISLIADDSLGFLYRSDDMGGGQYVVHFENAFRELAMACVERIIMERFSSKASRIFRVIRTKKFIEQEDLQKEAMIPSKESKFLSYSLFQEQFIHIRTIRKAGGGGGGPAKAFYLFHIKEKQVVKTLLDTCYKALCNAIIRSSYEKSENKRLIEKDQKLESIVATMKEREDAAEYISEIMETLTPPEKEILDKVKNRLKMLTRAEMELDENIFLLQMYLYYNAGPPGVVKS